MDLQKPSTKGKYTLIRKTVTIRQSQKNSIQKGQQRKEPKFKGHMMNIANNMKELMIGIDKKIINRKEIDVYGIK